MFLNVRMVNSVKRIVTCFKLIKSGKTIACCALTWSLKVIRIVEETVVLKCVKTQYQ